MNMYLTAALYLLLASGALALVEVGRWLGALRARWEHESRDAAGAGLSGLLALLAFMLAFTFSLTSERFAKRKDLVLQEANAISTAYLRTDFLADSDAARVRALLYAYTDVRLSKQLLDTRNAEKVAIALKRSEALTRQLWRAAAKAEAKAVSPHLYALFIASLNKVLDIGEDRKTVATVHRVPTPVWFMLACVSVLALLALGYQSGMLGRPRALPSVALAVAFSAVYLLTIDMDRFDIGFMDVSQQPVQDTLDAMRRDPRPHSENRDMGPPPL